MVVTVLAGAAFICIVYLICVDENGEEAADSEFQRVFDCSPGCFFVLVGFCGICFMVIYAIFMFCRAGISL